MQNKECDINKFFKINDNIAEEFYYIDRLNEPLQKLSGSLKALAALSGLEYGITIGVNSYINDSCQWLKEVCEENILIIHLDDLNKELVEVSTMMNERHDYRCIKDNDDNKVRFLRVPFDKAKYFSNFEPIYREKIDYIEEILTGKGETSLIKETAVEEEVKEIWRYKDLEVNLKKNTIKKYGEDVYLGKKPFNILRVLLENKGNLLTRNQIIDKVWGIGEDVNDRTVDSHISKIKGILDIDCIKSITGIGYKIEC